MWYASVPKLAIVGSTNIFEGKQWNLACLLIESFLRTLDPEEVISGGARGIDTAAKLVATGMGLSFKEYLPKVMTWEPFGFKERNLIIATECTHLLSIRSEQSTTYGSGWTADRAEEMGKTVWRVKI